MKKKKKNKINPEILMQKNLKKYVIIILVVLLFALAVALLKSMADTTNTSLEVSNVAPAFVSSTVKESTASTAAATVNENGSISFEASATDDNGDTFQLLVCKTDVVNPGATPGCGGGQQLCLSDETVSGGTASCPYSLPDDISANENQDWYAFACDNTGCSSSSQGNTSTGADSPYYINHRPDLTLAADNTGKNPGENVTWNIEFRENDNVNVGQDSITLYVCKANDFTGSACGAGGEWCHTGAIDGDPVSSSSDQSCQYSIPSPYADNNYAAYPFIVDNHGLAASGGAQGIDTVLQVNNVAPSVMDTSVFIANSNIETKESLTLLNAGTTSTKYIKFTIEDNNGCGTAELPIYPDYNNRISGVIGLFRYGCSLDGEGNPVDSATCLVSEWDLSNVYMAQNTFQIEDASQNLGKCIRNTSGTNQCSDPTTQNKIDVTCDFPMQHYADPTDVGSEYPDENWYAVVVVHDDDTEMFHSAVPTSGNWGKSVNVEVLSALHFAVNESSIEYGQLAVGGAASTADSTTLVAKGNTGVDQRNRAGDGASNPAIMCDTTVYPSCPADGVDDDKKLPASVQKFSATSDFNYDSAGVALSDSLYTMTDLHCVKPIVATPLPTATAYWKAKIPSTPAKKALQYKGLNTIVGMISDAANW